VLVKHPAAWIIHIFASSFEGVAALKVPERKLGAPPRKIRSRFGVGNPETRREFFPRKMRESDSAEAETELALPLNQMNDSLAASADVRNVDFGS
jgi:hypothetical protein